MLETIEVFPWNKNFETGIEPIDAQHKKLVLLLNKLANTLVKDDSVEVIAVFNELADYAAFHFEEEENIWKEYFKGEDHWMHSHLLAHSSFLPKVLNIKEQGQDKAWEDTIEHVLRFLIRWLAFHILDEDKKMSLVVKGMQAGKEFEAAKVQAERNMSGSIRVLIDTVLSMYDNLSSHALELVRERNRRLVVERELKQANERLALLSSTDELTGLYNRRYFKEVIPNEISRANRERVSVTFISIDLDHFKELNDRLGHLKGDKALQMVGECLTGMYKRSGDMCFRMGGEEFLVVITALTDEEARMLAEKVCAAIGLLCLENEEAGDCEQLSASVGVFNKVPDIGDTETLFLAKSDTAMYQAKKSGRNRVVISQ